jgi:predicted dehydrogenase (TIGR03970 family)
VVGAGTAGCPLAARLADAGRRVLLLEAGADHPRGFPGVLRDAATMRAAVPGAAQNWDLPVLLSDGVPARVPRGRVVGGSSALYAGAFIRGTPADFAGWAAAGNDLWSYEQVLPAFRRLEADADFGDRPEHGADGPVPVRRFPNGHPLADAFAAAAAELGFPAEPDKNAGREPGYGPIPFTVADGVRVNTAMAYLSPRRRSPGLTVRGGERVLRVVVEGGRAVGVQTPTETIPAGEVVLCAGAVFSAQLLLLSGIGPADQLRAHGIDVAVDAPGVGADFTDHPGVYVSYRPVRRLPVPPGRPPLHGALHVARDLEALPWLAPFAADGDLPVGVSLQRADSRGRLALAGPDPTQPPRLEYRYLSAEGDRRRMREAVRLAAELLAGRSLAPLVAERTGLPDDVLASDRELDAWIRARLTTALHLSGTARMGPDGDPGAVVDQHLRVRGVSGMRVADTSVLPWVPSRGTAATAVMIGERAADLMLGR